MGASPALAGEAEPSVPTMSVDQRGARTITT
jgi:hypothetical protein